MFVIIQTDKTKQIIKTQGHFRKFERAIDAAIQINGNIEIWQTISNILVWTRYNNKIWNIKD